MADRNSLAYGVQFPEIEGRRSSQTTGKGVFAGAVRYVDASLAEGIEATRNWHKDYLGAVRETVEIGARSPKDALRISADGLEDLHRRFVFETEEGTTSLEDAFSEPSDPAFGTATIEGRGERLLELEIPYRGEVLRGDRLRRQLDRWQAAGTVEPSCARAVAALMDDPDRLDLRGLRIALLGAASEMGPLAWLTRWGAEILAVDLPVPTLWKRIIAHGREGAGAIHLPVRVDSADVGSDPEKVAGADLLTQAPQIAAWLSSFGGPFVLGNHAYADGGLFVRVAVAADAIVTDLQAKGHLDGYAYLASPTEVFAVPRSVVDASRSKGSPLVAAFLRRATGERLFAPNYEDARQEDESGFGVFDCLVPQQGPNYALAKTLQRWRALIVRDQGVMTSANVAPATRTRSVVKNGVLAAAYAGAKPFGVEVFEPETSRALMAALLVHDIRDPAGVAQPDVELSHPFDLFSAGAAHGGLWRMRYAPRSALPLAVLLGYPKRLLARSGS